MRSARSPDARTRPLETDAGVSWSPAAIPATFVACSEFCGSNGVFAYFQAGCAGANAFATITFGVVYACSPSGSLRGT